MPGAKVDRASFLRSQLTAYCEDEQVNKAIELGPARAGVSPDLTDHLADSTIKSHTVKASALSFGAGLPGGFAMLATIPVDTAQFYWHTIVVSQKLAYLYGWPALYDRDVKLDEETELRIVLFLGAMMRADGARKILSKLSSSFAKEMTVRIPRYALTKTAYYPLVKTVLRWVGVSVTKQSFAKGISKVVPIVGGAVSGGITFITLRSMARNLKGHLKELKYAQPSRVER